MALDKEAMVIALFVWLVVRSVVPRLPSLTVKETVAVEVRPTPLVTLKVAVFAPGVG